MITNLIRLFIIYFLTIFSFRLMGKRQVGELQLSELVCAIFISELATVPVDSISTPLIHGIIPIIFLVSFEVIISFLSIKIPLVKRAFDSTPEILIEKGELYPKRLARARMTVEELMSELRQQGYSSMGDVYYAILEANGKLSIIPKGNKAPPTSEALKINSPNDGIDRAVIIGGKINKAALADSGKDMTWLDGTIKEHGIKRIEEIFLLTVNESDDIYIVRRKE